MVSAKLIKLSLVVVGLILLTGTMLMAGLRWGGIHPGGDTRIMIAPDLALWISSRDHWSISYVGDAHTRQTVIDARVDAHKLHGYELHVARTPVFDKFDGAVLRSIVTEECEFLALNVRTLEVRPTDNPLNLRCRDQAGDGSEQGSD